MALLAKLAENGVIVELVNGRLRVRTAAPMTDAQRQFLRDYKPELIAELTELGAAAEANDSTAAADLTAIAWAEPVHCADCVHFQPGANPLRGRCGAGVTLVAPLTWHQRGQRVAVGFGDPELWATDSRGCESWVPHGLAEAVNATADRWGYSDAEREWALEQALQKPQEWLRLIEADLQGRRWPGGDRGQD